MFTLGMAPFCLPLVSGIARLGFPYREDPPPDTSKKSKTDDVGSQDLSEMAGGITGGLWCRGFRTASFT